MNSTLQKIENYYSNLKIFTIHGNIETFKANKLVEQGRFSFSLHNNVFYFNEFRLVPAANNYVSSLSFIAEIGKQVFYTSKGVATVAEEKEKLHLSSAHSIFMIYELIIGEKFLSSEGSSVTEEGMIQCGPYLFCFEHFLIKKMTIELGNKMKNVFYYKME